MPRLRSSHILASMVLALVFSSCTALQPGKSPRELFAKKTWTHEPAWASGAISSAWWKDYRSPALTRDIEIALAQNPGLRAHASRLEQATAIENTARAATYPRLNLGFGAREGRKREADFGPYDLKPFTASSELSWEIDLSGKLRAATRSAREAKNAAFWDLRAAELNLAAEVAEAHFRTARLSQELDLIKRATASHQKTIAVLRAKETAGLISETLVQQQLARQSDFDQALLDLARLHGLATLQLATLKGQASPAANSPSTLPATPSGLPKSSTTALLRQRPDLLAAESRVRASFQQEEATRLDLLPSFSFNASTAGATNSLTNRFRVWEAQVGPTLSVPIYDPVRLAKLKSRRAQTKTAAATYRATVLKAFEETESAYLNYENRRGQLSSARQATSALDSAHQNITASHQAGIVSDLELLESERQLLNAQRTEIALRQTLLTDHLALIRALGGGTGNK